MKKNNNLKFQALKKLHEELRAKEQQELAERKLKEKFQSGYQIGFWKGMFIGIICALLAISVSHSISSLLH